MMQSSCIRGHRARMKRTRKHVGVREGVSMCDGGAGMQGAGGTQLAAQPRPPLSQREICHAVSVLFGLFASVPLGGEKAAQFLANRPKDAT